MYTPTLEELKEADQDCQGFCRNCGEIAEGVEPDAENYECECCGQHQVFGAQEFAMRGWVR